MRIVTGIQPTNVVTLGNYLGAMQNVVKLQKRFREAEFYIFVADLHSLTIERDSKELRQNIKTLAALYLSLDLDLSRTHIFIQSEVSEHAELAYILECNSYFGEMSRMIQFKEKSQKQGINVTTGLFTYPCLMAADILLYDAEYVPVGEDQKQHIELTRDIAERFNSKYSETFVIPKPYIEKDVQRIMSLQDPLKKMSKSDPNPKGYITLLDNVNEAKNKIKRAVTDSIGVIKYDPENQPGLANLLSIYSALTSSSLDSIVEKYKESNYQVFKDDLANIVGEFLEDIQKKYNDVLKSGELDRILDEGRDAAKAIAYKKIAKVKRKVGLGRIR